MNKIPELRVVSKGRYDDKGYTDEASIANLMLSQPHKINSMLTYNYGLNGSFPLLFLTEGRGKKGIAYTTTNQWTWDVMNEPIFIDYVTHCDIAESALPGLGGMLFDIHFNTNRFIESFTIIAGDGVTQLYIHKDHGKSEHGFKYTVSLSNAGANSTINGSLLKKGQYFSMAASTVTESYSVGNKSTSYGPGKMRGQLEFGRYSKEIGGDVANTVVDYQFKTEDGKTSNLWLNEEMRQFFHGIRVMEEERLWTAQYNRDSKGNIRLTNPDNNKAIPHCSGMLEICKEANYDTYGKYLPFEKLKRNISDLIENSSSDGKMEIIVSAGKGFIDDVDLSIKKDAMDKGFLTPLGAEEIKSINGGLEYGAYFKAFKTIEGHRVILKHTDFFDRSNIAKAAKANGRVHPRTGLPITSHSAAIMDFSTYNGEQNIRLVHKKGRESFARVIKGMAPVPASWGLNTDGVTISTGVDASRYEVMKSRGLQVYNNKAMMYMECVLD